MIDKKFMRMMRRKWYDMIRRCKNPRSTAWANYGGRGITVCKRWEGSFDAYLKDVGLPPEPGMTLDRIDNDGNYEPGNVRWATMSDQINNRRRDGNYGRRGLNADDARRILADIEAGVPYSVIAAEWEITPYMVSHIATGRCWGSATGRIYRPRVID